MPHHAGKKALSDHQKADEFGMNLPSVYPQASVNLNMGMLTRICNHSRQDSTGDIPEAKFCKIGQKSSHRADNALSWHPLLTVLQPKYTVPRRQVEDVVVEENAYIRVHCLPKRFPAVYAYDWKVDPLA